MVDAGGSESDGADSVGGSAGQTRQDHTRSEAPAGTQIIDAAAERGRRGRGVAAEAWLDQTDADLPVTEGIPPSWSDRFVRAASQRLGGPLGRRADTVGRWW